MASIDLSKYHSGKKISVDRTIDGNGIVEFLQSDITLFQKKFGAKEKEAFYSELGLLLSTGIDIKKAFDIIKEDIKDKGHRKIIDEIDNRIISGMSVYESIKAQHKVFSSYEFESVRIGEESGKLPEVLIELGQYYKSGIQLKRQIVGVLTYPIVVISMAILIVYFMLSYVVPIFSDVFTQTGNELPAITQFLIALSAKSNLFMGIIVLIFGFVYLIHRTQHKKAWYRQKTSYALLKVPVVGKLIQKIYLARFCQSMKLLIGARVMINDALELVKNMIEFYPIEVAIEQIKKDVVNEGKQLNESMAKHTIFPTKLVALIKLSEEVNAPEVIFTKLHKQYVAEVEHQQLIVGKIIEPLFIVILGLFVGFILVAMYLPMFEMSTGTF